jgi:hypothetical protein
MPITTRGTFEAQQTPEIQQLSNPQNDFWSLVGRCSVLQLVA